MNLAKNVNLNKNYSYPTTICESSLTQMHVFLVKFTIIDFYHERSINKNWKDIFSTRKFTKRVTILGTE